MGRNSEWMNSALVGKDGFCRTPFAPALFAQDYFAAFDHFCPSMLVDATHFPGFTVSEITATDAGTLVMQDLPGGVLGLVGTTYDGAGIQMQQIGLPFLPAANKDLYFEARVKAIVANDIDLFVGLAAADTNVFSTDPTDLIAFRADDGSAALNFQVRNSGTGAAAATGVSLVNDTWIRIGFHVQGVTKVTPYVDGVEYTAVAANIPVAGIGLTFGMCGGTTDANKLLIDWYRCLQFA